MSVGTTIVVMAVFGTITAVIAQKKNLRVGEWFIAGALLPIIALGLVLLQRPALPKAPAGMVAVRCPGCNAVQNVALGAHEYVCWQCRSEHEWA